MWFISPAATGGVSSVPLNQSPPNMALQQDMNAAFLDYALIGLLDPRNLLDAKGIARLMGISYIGGLTVASLGGFLLVGALITAIDPQHKYEGGLDETQFYKDNLASIGTLPGRTSLQYPLRYSMANPSAFMW